MFHLTLERGYSLTTMAAVATVAVLLIWLGYRRAFGGMRKLHARALLALRITAVVLVVLLIFRPVVSYEKHETQRPALVFLLDTSASMRIADSASDQSRLARARDQIAKWWPKLADGFDLHLVAFSEGPRVLGDVRRLATLSADGRATSLSRAIQSGARQAPPRRIEAIVLLSDGLHNAAGDPVQVAGSRGVVVHTVGVGSSLRSDATYRDLQVTGIDCPDRLLVGNKAKIVASVEGVGLAGHVAQVVLEEDDRQIEQAELTLDGVEGAQRVEFQFRPEAKGRHTYTVRALPAAEEKIQENNDRRAVALVVEAGIRVLYLEGTLRAEYGAIVDRFLAKDPDLEFAALVQTRPNVFLSRTNIEGLALTSIPTDAETLDTFDVFILGDLDASYLRPEVQELLVRRIRAGAGLVMLGGYHSLGPGGYAETPLGVILPARLGSREIGQIDGAFLPALSPEGARHPIFANIAGFFATEAGPPETPGLPPLEGCTRVEGPRPTATVLAYCPAEVDRPVVLAVQPVDAGRAAVFTGDTTRVWQQGPQALDQKSPFLQFWGQMVRWLAGRQEGVQTTAGVTGRTDKAYYEPDEPVRISAVVRDNQGQGAAGAKVTAKIAGTMAKPQSVALAAESGPAGHYGARFEPAAPGTYQIDIEAALGETKLAAEKLVVEVGRPSLEFEKLDLDETLLGRIAAASGGRYAHVTTADRLIDELDRTQRRERILMERRLYWPPVFWALFVGILAAEWILRRRFQLR
ncbi:MAG: hypothetical protein JW809_16690 [Pirellulales bacterium]|nr:hypothetical protein [Pirellulales bacterium]